MKKAVQVFILLVIFYFSLLFCYSEGRRNGHKEGFKSGIEFVKFTNEISELNKQNENQEPKE